MTTICSPLDIPYRFQDQSMGPFKRSINREGADPSLVEYHGRYYLFVSMSAGFWHSTDLVHWDFVNTPMLPNYDYAPDARVVDDYLVVCASRPSSPCPFFRTQDPIGGVWEEIEGSQTFWDPNLLQDDDGRLYLFQGCSARKPIDGVELDRTTFTPIGEPVPIIRSDTHHHGWERKGDNWDPATDETSLLVSTLGGPGPFIEGAWVTKHDGRYYLQYSAPGTQLNTYADGYYVADSPLGPYTYAPSSPYSSKPGGFMPAAGHGSLMQDAHGNWWKTATMRISVNQMFERRIGMWPAGFDGDGVLFCNQEFADYPLEIPDGRVDPWSLTPTWMLLSYGRAIASASDPAHQPGLAVNEDAQTWWVAPDTTPGHWVQTEIVDGALVHAVQVNLAEHEMRPATKPRWKDTETTGLTRRRIDTSDPAAEILLQASTDGRVWTDLADTRGTGESRSHIYVELDEAQPYRFVRVSGYAQPYGGRFAVSGLRVFGVGAGSAPAVVAPSARRTGSMNAQVTWAAAAGAQGYNVRYGIAPDKLYSSWQLWGRTSLDLGSLNAGHAYWIAVDSFNEAGVTRGEPVSVAAHPLLGTARA